MLPAVPINGDKVGLRPLSSEADLSAYLAWMNDPDLVRYLEARFRTFTRDDLTDYIRKMNDSADQLLLGIFAPSDGAHVGNIKLGPVDMRHRRADVGILIGAAEAREKGYATDALRALVRYGFEHLSLHKITASCYVANVSSLRLFERVGFAVEGVRREHHFCDGAWTDTVFLGILETDMMPETEETV